MRPETVQSIWWLLVTSSTTNFIPGKLLITRPSNSRELSRPLLKLELTTVLVDFKQRPTNLSIPLIDRARTRSMIAPSETKHPRPTNRPDPFGMPRAELINPNIS